MSYGHENGYAFSEDQRDSHPEPFVFIDDANRPYKAMRWSGEWWLFYWHDAQSNWVSLRKVGGDELRELRPQAVPPEQADLYERPFAVRLDGGGRSA